MGKLVKLTMNWHANKLQEGILIEEENEIENKSGSDCLNKYNTPYKELVRLTKQHHLNYKGTKQDICIRLEDFGYIFNNPVDKITKNTKLRCYKFNRL